MPEVASSNVLFDLWLLSRTANRVIGEATRAGRLSADDFGVYSLLAAGPLTPTELAYWVDAPATTVSSYVARFERRGHVQRMPSAADARSYRVALTPAGRAAHERAGVAFLELLDSVEKAVEKAVGPDRAAVREALHTLRRALGGVGPPAAGPDG